MNRSFITYHRRNKELHTSKLNGFPFVSFGVPVGQINGATCFESVTITIGGKRERVVTANDFGGPVSIRVETKGQTPQWFGLASKMPVRSADESRPCEDSYLQEISA
ncbi:MAG: hypothetical protein ACF8CQ_10030 [Rhodopirellula sp. JB044]|uniref:hypothetical protein n=1 Tax=Rhodopirellula sp. JB044 TaxID=3342844 RepID=UPI00370BE888